MRRLRLCGYAVCFRLMFVTISMAAADVPLEMFGRLPSLENMTLSPDGAHIAFTMTKDEGRFVYILSLKDMKVFR